jgi:pantothenate kinase
MSFPHHHHNNQLKDEKKLQQEKLLSQSPDPSIYFVKQLVGNACGTIAVVHAIANNLQKIQLEGCISIKNLLTFERKST